MEQTAGIRLEPLGGGLHIYIDKKCNFGTDAVLLADFSSPGSQDRTLDLGTGCGVIPLLWHKERGPLCTIGVEIRPEVCEMAKASVRLAGLDQRIEIVNADFRFLPAQWRGGFDLIACNPPYFPADGAKSPHAARAAARSEGSCRLADVVRTARRLLRPEGRFCLCQRPERLEELTHCLRREGLRLTRLRFVSHSREKAPFLILAQAGRTGTCALLPHLFLTEGGQPSAEYRRIYKDFF